MVSDNESYWLVVRESQYFLALVEWVALYRKDLLRFDVSIMTWIDIDFWFLMMIVFL